MLGEQAACGIQPALGTARGAFFQLNLRITQQQAHSHGQLLFIGQLTLEAPGIEQQQQLAIDGQRAVTLGQLLLGFFGLFLTQRTHGPGDGLTGSLDHAQNVVSLEHLAGWSLASLLRAVAGGKGSIAMPLQMPCNCYLGAHELA